MRKIISIVLSVLMLLNMAVGMAVAEETAYPKPYDTNITAIEGTDVQPELESHVKAIIEVDGLKFRDLNGNGTLDGYEDWRLDTEERITNLLSLMTLEEKVALLYHTNTAGQNGAPYPVTDKYLYATDCPFVPEASDTNSAGYSCWYYISEYGITHFLDNSNGAPHEQIYMHNAMQEMAEAQRLGIPMTISCDRSYNSWGGFIDSPHTAFGAAANLELAEKIWAHYAQEMAATGYHVTLQPTGVQLGSWYGEDAANAAKMVSAEIKTYQANNTATCTKHFISNSFSSSRSIAQTYENWMVPWDAAINEAGTGWIMTNGYSTGLTNNTVNVDYDKTTMNYLRNVLGFKGVVLTDWGAMGSSDNNVWYYRNSGTGITAEGEDINNLTLPERYALVCNNGVDQFGGLQVAKNPEEFEAGLKLGHAHANEVITYLDPMVDAVEQGLVTMERLEEADRRVLRTKFNLGLFENPYSSVEEAMAIACSAEFAAAPWEITDNASLNAARNPELVALEQQLQSEAAVLIKNDNNLLPLEKGIKVYFAANSESTAKLYANAAAKYCTVVESAEEADVVVGDFSRIDDAAEMLILDAEDFNKPLVLSLNNTAPTQSLMDSGDALIQLNFTRGADHGRSQGEILTTTEPEVFVDLLFGVREPGGTLVAEVARDSADSSLAWGDLANDVGASDYVRLLLLGIMKEDPAAALPNNFGDPLLCAGYGMKYGAEPAFEYSTLILPTGVKVTETESNGSKMIQSSLYTKPQKSGEAFTVSFLLMNNGDAGIEVVNVYDNGTLINQKTVAINDNSWRVVEIEVVVNGAGEHVITVGPLSGTVTVE